MSRWKPLPFDEWLVPAGDCLLWTGHVNQENGYGRYTAAGRQVYAHRYAYERAFGAIPPGMFVCHRCDVPSCVRPAHLFLGTHADNMADARAKGHNGQWNHPERTARGERQGNSRLTADLVRQARDAREAGARLIDVAAMLGVSVAHAHRIVTGQSWRHA